MIRKTYANVCELDFKFILKKFFIRIICSIFVEAFLSEFIDCINPFFVELQILCWQVNCNNVFNSQYELNRDDLYELKLHEYSPAVIK